MQGDPTLICLLEWTLVLVSVFTLILAASDLVPAVRHFRASCCVAGSHTPRFEHLRLVLNSAFYFVVIFMPLLGLNESNIYFWSRKRVWTEYEPFRCSHQSSLYLSLSQAPSISSFPYPRARRLTRGT